MFNGNAMTEKQNDNNRQVSLFDYINTCEALAESDYISDCESIEGKSQDEIIAYFDKLNDDPSNTGDNTCTPMSCVKAMIDYIPSELWARPNIKVLDPCCGNGNFGAYCMTKTAPENIYYNDNNPIRIKNCIKLLNPKHFRYGDAFALRGEFDTSYDLIMANPPYSGGGNKNRSISNEFIEEGIRRLNERGYLCFITPNNWMTYNNDNSTLRKLLNEGSFVVIDNNVKKYFPSVGSSFTVIVWQKGVFDNKTTVYNNYLIKDVQKNIKIPKKLKFLPLYISQTVLNIVKKIIQEKPNKFRYRCDLHNFTQKSKLSDNQEYPFLYETIHTARITRYANIKQDIYDKWIIVVPLSTYYTPYIRTNVNTTQSVGYFAFKTQEKAEQYLEVITRPIFKVIIHLTRYGNFNNIAVLKHLKFNRKISLTFKQESEIDKLNNLMKY